MANQRKGVSPEKQAWSLTYSKNGADRLRGPLWGSRSFGIALAVLLLVGVAGMCHMLMMPDYMWMISPKLVTSTSCRLVHQDQGPSTRPDIHTVEVRSCLHCSTRSHCHALIGTNRAAAALPVTLVLQRVESARRTYSNTPSHSRPQHCRIMFPPPCRRSSRGLPGSSGWSTGQSAQMPALGAPRTACAMMAGTARAR